MALYNFGDRPLSVNPDKSTQPTGKVNSNVKANPTINTPVKEPVRDHITATVYKEKLSDGTDLTNLYSVEGIKWNVVYYNQVLAKDDSPRQLDLGLDRTLQQYIRVNGMALYLQGDGLAYSRDGATGIGLLEGEVYIYPGLVPQPGDMLVGVTDDGRSALFVVTEPDRLSHRTLSAHRFNVKLFNYAEDKYTTNLDIKTIKVYNYDENAAYCGEGLVEESVTTNTKKANTYIKELVNFYYDKFFDKLTKTFLYPHPTHRIYDHATAEFFIKLISKELRQFNPAAMLYNVDSTEYRDTIQTIWDVFIHNTMLWNKRVMKTYELRATSEYVSAYTFNHVSHSHVSHIMTPVKLNSVLIEVDDEEGLDYYVFSKAFYEKDHSKVTRMEAYLLAAMEGVLPSMDNVISLINEMMDKDEAKQFHEVPVLLWILLKIGGAN